MTVPTTTVRHQATARELASLRRRETAFGHRARARALAHAHARAEAAERLHERWAGRPLGLVEHINRSRSAVSDFDNGIGRSRSAVSDFAEFDNGINGDWEASFRFFNEATPELARWMLSSSEREQIRRERVLRRASAITPAPRRPTHVRRARARCSHRVVRAVRVTKTAAGDSGDGDPEPPEPPTTRRYLGCEVAP